VAGWFVITLPGTDQQSAAQNSVSEVAGAPAFEVISIRSHEPGYWPKSGEMARFTRDGFVGRNTSVQRLIILAYNLRDPKMIMSQIPGAPKWVRSEWYEFDAKMSESDITELSKLSIEQQQARERQMLQSMLADRFKLKVHLETKEVQAYTLIMAKNRPKNMKEVPEDASLKLNWSDFDHVQCQAARMADLLMFLEGLEGVPILDKTGLTGKYDFKLEFGRDPATLPPGYVPTDNESEPSIFTALQEQLGLKLVSTRAPLEVIVIDHIEKASPN
jgi:bla regulator protein blaR1